MALSDVISRGQQVLASLRSQSSQIVDGYTNLFLEGLDILAPEAQAVYAARYAICMGCPMRVGNACSKHQRQKRVGTDCYVRGCGCHLNASTKAPSKACPMHKWPPVSETTLEELPYPPDKANNPCTKR